MLSLLPGGMRGGSRGGGICAAFCRTSRCSSDRNQGPSGPTGKHTLRHTGVQGTVPWNTLRTVEAWNMTGKGLAGDHPGTRAGSDHGRVEVCSRAKDFPRGHRRWYVRRQEASWDTGGRMLSLKWSRGSQWPLWSREGRKLEANKCLSLGSTHKAKSKNSPNTAVHIFLRLGKKLIGKIKRKHSYCPKQC